MSAASIGLITFPRTTIGKKVIMAVTGLIWIGYVIAHMYGNLKVFEGPEYFNAYAEGLRELGAPILGYAQFLWVARLVLLVAIVAHVWAAVTLWLLDRKTRSTSYTERKNLVSSAAGRTMIYGGIAIVLFIFYHLLHLTLGVPFVHADFIQGDVYHNVVVGFRSIPVTIIYLIALVALGFHLFHGTWSMFQTVGLINKSYDKIIRGLAWFVAILVPLGFALVPISVMLRIIS
jgi:succinate dehydrogenase / fumarate reductase cytochrome b subunit